MGTRRSESRAERRARFLWVGCCLEKVKCMNWQKKVESPSLPSVVGQCGGSADRHGLSVLHSPVKYP